MYFKQFLKFLFSRCRPDPGPELSQILADRPEKSHTRQENKGLAFLFLKTVKLPNLDLVLKN